MKRLFSIWILVAAALALFSCAQEPLPQTLVTDLGLDEPEMPVRIGFDLPYEKPLEAGTRASIVGGEEDPDEYVKNLYMICFTHDGIYLGWRQAILVGDEQNYHAEHPVADLNCQGRELFEGTVPSRTARIHFVANVTEANIPGNDQIGNNENTLVKSARMTSLADENDVICYWGFHGEGSSEEMKGWLALANYDPITQTTTYSKKPGHNIHMIRDRARVYFGYMFDFNRLEEDCENGDVVRIDGHNYTITDGHITIDNRDYTIEKNITDYRITSISWVLSNGLSRGYLAPYCADHPEDHFDFYFDSTATPMLKEDRITPYDKADATRYTATESDLMTVYTYDPGTGNESYYDSPLFLFEDLNDPSNPPKLILKVVYQVDGKAQPVTKYHALMMLNEANEPAKIYRNHSYCLNIFGLPWEGVGYATFDDAVNGHIYSNNQTVTIDDQVTEINDGHFQLSIVGHTFLMYNDPALCGTQQHIRFTYAAVDGVESTAGIQASDFIAKWTSNIYASFAEPTITVTQVSNDGTTFTGDIAFTLGTSINAELQSGQIELRDRHTGLTRFINIYTITKFNWLPAGASQLELVPTGESRNINGTACNTYKLMIRIPGNYPIGLYPIKIRMATLTLNPYAVQLADEEDDNIAVVMEGTENGTTLDGTTLSGMDFTASASNKNQWNYRAAGSPWNFWYTYTLTSKPTREENGATVEDTQDKLYTILFDDIRPMRAAGNRAENIGLFLFINYFGPAVPVTVAP